ncbi:MAG TPA: hypothetical protein DEA52_05095 [Clostridiaceae bacterium]|nr:hypothetical protein [Clostridiaceae bacterium]
MEKKGRNRQRLEKVLGAAGWGMLLVVSVFLVFTTLHLNGVLSWPFFDTYLPVQWAIFIGLVVWGCRFYINARKYPSYLRYSVFALVFSVIQLIFLLSGVY